MEYVKLCHLNDGEWEDWAKAGSWNDFEDLVKESGLEKSEIRATFTDIEDIPALEKKFGKARIKRLPEGAEETQVAPIFIVAGGRFFLEGTRGFTDPDNRNCVFITEGDYENLF